MKDKPKTNKPTFETVWAALQETDLLIKELKVEVEKTTKSVNKVSETVGQWSNNHGAYAEEYFINAFANGKCNFFGETFDVMMKRRSGMATKDEFDIVLINGQSVCIIETKFKAHVNDIPKVLTKPAAFRSNFPDYKNYNIYLGLSSLTFYDVLEDELKKNGIAIIKQVGDKVVIWDEELKTY